MKLINDMSRDELMEFWWEHNILSRKKAEKLFPDKPKGYVRTMKDLAAYASNLATYKQYGKEYGKIADIIYSELPDYAKELVR